MSFNGKILLVDDEPHVRKFIGLIVRQLGEPLVFEATNGREAVELYTAERPDLVLLDINMPLMDGLEALRELKRIDPDCTVVMLTSLATRQSIEEALNLGATNYLRKDSAREEILASLQELLSEDESEEENA